jgi:hypothetical protein
VKLVTERVQPSRQKSFSTTAGVVKILVFPPPCRSARDLRKLRKSLGMKPGVAGSKLGLSAVAYAELENGAIVPIGVEPHTWENAKNTLLGGGPIDIRG